MTRAMPKTLVSNVVRRSSAVISAALITPPSAFGVPAAEVDGVAVGDEAAGGFVAEAFPGT
ncbi:hypothetical protein [Amycolatopsis sp. lyj-112]|uniref:hypothetical protein n=1 Tax=Amycolatopsis sp. lyj-112 TaxID=2789288 RepID=UPI003978D1D0